MTVKRHTLITSGLLLGYWSSTLSILYAVCDLQILDALDIEPHCKKMHLAHKLENVACTLEGEETSTC